LRQQQAAAFDQRYESPQWNEQRLYGAVDAYQQQISTS
jgi:hypothetical protein